MIISLDKTWRSELLFNPARNADGKLQGLEIVVNFVGVNREEQTPAELILPYLAPQQTEMLFIEQLHLLSVCQLFFIQHQITAWINITPTIVDRLLQDDDLAASVNRFPFIEFMINENYLNVNDEGENTSLSQLGSRYPLVLANFGAGGAPTRAVFDGLFSRVMLDKNFVYQRLKSPSFQPFMQAIINQVEPYCRSMMIAGIDSEQTLKRVAPFSFSAMQGRLWPPVPPEQVTQLVK
ncbi:EAL domain-containing protein [Escherichia sp. ESNIH1]|uniref:EAL domain-containing protein n=1 Tax=Escherichia sp. ESNIH1 TaxID=1985876 RepID=UPI000CDD9F64|nr:EAL domain-containing protein [Escherichia sp. ESNIH1]POT99554.1 EAL domain-containing protein [Escherichia sp. ESNIH1]